MHSNDAPDRFWHTCDMQLDGRQIGLLIVSHHALGGCAPVVDQDVQAWTRRTASQGVLQHFKLDPTGQQGTCTSHVVNCLLDRPAHVLALGQVTHDCKAVLHLFHNRLEPLQPSSQNRCCRAIRVELQRNGLANARRSSCALRTPEYIVQWRTVTNCISF